jgi:hypothetical protein
MPRDTAVLLNEEDPGSLQRATVWISTHPLDAATVGVCLVAGVAALFGWVSAGVLNAAMLAALAVVAIDLIRIGRLLNSDAMIDRVAEAVSRRVYSGRTLSRVIEEPATLYDEAVDLVRTCRPTDARKRVIKIASLRPPSQPRRPQTNARTDRLINACLARMADGWKIRRIVGVAVYDIARLDRELQRPLPVCDAGAYEMKVIVGNPVPVLAPLLIGYQHAVIGTHDAEGAGIERGLILTDDASIDFVDIYFDRLWALPEAILVRTAAGPVEDGVARVRGLLDAGSAPDVEGAGSDSDTCSGIT